MQAKPAANDKKPIKFALISANEFSRRPLPKWLIKGILPMAELGVMFGEPGCGKTFLTLDQAMAIARGIDWYGHKTKQGRVVYVAAEAPGSVAMRVRAYATYHGVALETLDFQFIDEAPSFLKPGDAKLIAEQIGGYPTPSVIYIDTLASIMAGGDEGGSVDMGMAISQAKILHDLTGAMIVLIHHCGKDSTKGARGWSGLHGAADVEIEISNVQNPRIFKVTKQKDGKLADELGFDIISVDLEEDEDGDMVTSCITIQTSVIVKKDKKTEKLGPVEELIIDAYKRLKTADREDLIEVEEVVARVKEKMPVDPNKRDQRTGRIIRSIERLCQNNGFSITGKYIIRI